MADCQAVDWCELLMLPRDDFAKLMTEDRELYEGFKVAKFRNNDDDENSSGSFSTHVDFQGVNRRCELTLSRWCEPVVNGTDCLYAHPET